VTGPLTSLDWRTFGAFAIGLLRRNDSKTAMQIAGMELEARWRARKGRDSLRPERSSGQSSRGF
jgi:hypothetical protein